MFNRTVVKSIGNIEQNVRDWIYVHDSVRNRFVFSIKAYHNRYDEEPLFESVDSLSMKLPTRDEAIQQIKRRKAMEYVNTLVETKDDKKFDVETIENGVRVGSFVLERDQDELEKRKPKPATKK